MRPPGGQGLLHGAAPEVIDLNGHNHVRVGLDHGINRHGFIRILAQNVHEHEPQRLSLRRNNGRRWKKKPDHRHSVDQKRQSPDPCNPALFLAQGQQHTQPDRQAINQPKVAEKINQPMPRPKEPDDGPNHGQEDAGLEEAGEAVEEVLACGRC